MNSFFFCSGYGSDITDSSANVFDHYSTTSVTGCTSNSTGVKFYASTLAVVLDCLLTGVCVTDYLYVSTSGLDYNLCGEEQSACQTFVCSFV
jgi:hypothetical protein